MSVLIPGQDPLQHRACLNRYDWDLLQWFGDIEAAAWEAVTARCGARRPDKIFLVKGQTLSSEYWICHQERNERFCEATVETSTSLPSALEGGVLLGTGFHRVTASTGFEISPPIPTGAPNPPLYSVYFETEDSFPINLFKFRGPRLQKRLSVMHR